MFFNIFLFFLYITFCFFSIYGFGLLFKKLVFKTNQNILYSGGKDALLKVFNLSLNHTNKIIPAHNYAIYDIIQLNKSIILSCSRDKTIKVWDKKNMSIISRLDHNSNGHKHSVNNIIKYKNDMFFSCSDDGTIILWKC